MARRTGSAAPEDPQARMIRSRYIALAISLGWILLGWSVAFGCGAVWLIYHNEIATYITRSQ